MYFDDKGWPKYNQFIFMHLTTRPERQTIVRSDNVRDLKWDKFIVLKDNDQYVIWGGWHKVNTAICVSRGIDIGGCICEKRWPYGDTRYLLRARLELIDNNIFPVVEFLLPLQPERLSIYQTISEQQ